MRFRLDVRATCLDTRQFFTNVLRHVKNVLHRFCEKIYRLKSIAKLSSWWYGQFICDKWFLALYRFQCIVRLFPYEGKLFTAINGFDNWNRQALGERNRIFSFAPCVSDFNTSRVNLDLPREHRNDALKNLQLFASRNFILIIIHFDWNFGRACLRERKLCVKRRTPKRSTYVLCIKRAIKALTNWRRAKEWVSEEASGKRGLLTLRTSPVILCRSYEHEIEHTSLSSDAWTSVKTVRVPDTCSSY